MISLDDVAVMAAGVFAFVAVAAAWYGWIEINPYRARAKSLTEARVRLSAAATQSPKGHEMRQKSLGAMRGVVKQLNLMRSRQAAKMAANLAQAGWRSRDAMIAYLFMKFSLPLVFGVLGSFLIFGLDLGRLPPMLKLLAPLIMVVAGAYAPDLFVRNASSKRRTQLRRSLPDGLDLLVICVEAGLSFEAALGRTAREIRAAAPELSDEFELTAIELGFLPDRRKALDNLAARTDLPSVRGVVNTLQQSEQYGTPLAQALRVLASEFRTDRLMRAEEKAARLPTILTVPMIVFILPTLFVVLLGPGILQAIDSLSRL